MAEILASIEVTDDGRILYLRAYSEVRIPMEVGSEHAARNGKLVLKDTKKVGLHLAVFGNEVVGEEYQWVFHGSCKLDRPGIYHFAMKPDKNRRSYSGPGDLYYAYRVRKPEEESDPVRRKLREEWNSCSRLRVNEVLDWGETFELEDLHTRHLDRDDLPFSHELLLTDGSPRMVQQHKDRRHVRIQGGTYVVVVLEEANGDPYDHKMYRRGITRVYRKPDADLQDVLAAIEVTNPRRFSNINLF